MNSDIYDKHKINDMSGRRFKAGNLCIYYCNDGSMVGGKIRKYGDGSISFQNNYYILYIPEIDDISITNKLEIIL